MALNCQALRGGVIVSSKSVPYQDAQGRGVKLDYSTVTLNNHKCSGEKKAYYYIDQNGNIAATSLCAKAAKDLPDQAKYQASTSYYNYIKSFFDFSYFTNNNQAAPEVYGNRVEDKTWNLDLHPYDHNTECLMSLSLQHKFGDRIPNHGCSRNGWKAASDIEPFNLWTKCATHDRMDEITQRTLLPN